MPQGYDLALAQYDNAMPEEPHFIRCFECQSEIYDGEIGYWWDEEIICADCLEDHWSELTLPEKAKLLGAEEHTVGNI